MFSIQPFEVGGRHHDLLHKNPSDSDENADDACDNPAVPVVPGRLLLDPLLVAGAVTRQVVEDFILQQVVSPAIFVTLCSNRDRRFLFLHAVKRQRRLNLAI